VFSVSRAERRGRAIVGLKISFTVLSREPARGLVGVLAEEGREVYGLSEDKGGVLLFVPVVELELTTSPT
jgi:hypothetical protein